MRRAAAATTAFAVPLSAYAFSSQQNRVAARRVSGAEEHQSREITNHAAPVLRPLRFFSPSLFPGIVHAAVFSRFQVAAALAEDTQAPAAANADENAERQPGELPPVEKYDFVIVGLGACGFHALQELVRESPESKILVIAAEDSDAYMRPPLSKDLWDKPVDTEDGSAPREFRDWDGNSTPVFLSADHAEYDHPTVEVSRGNEVVDMDTVKKLVLLADDRLIEYGTILYATGSQPQPLAAAEAVRLASIAKDAPEEAKEQASRLEKHVTSFRSLADFDRILEVAKTSEDILVVGNSFVATELSSALARFSTAKRDNQLGVWQMFGESGVLGGMLPDYLSEYASARLKAREGVKVLPGKEIESMRVTDCGHVIVKFVGGGQVAVHHVVVATEGTPSTGLFKLGNLEIDQENGGVVVNNEFEARRDLFVAGDAASFHDLYVGRRRVENHEHAMNSGRLAARNMLGRRELYAHLPMFWGDVSDFSYEAVGIVDSSKYRTFGVWDRTASEEEGEEPKSHSGGADKKDPQEYKRGVVYYLDNKDIVVGVLLWNVWDRVEDARQLIKRGWDYPQTEKGFEDLQRGINLQTPPPQSAPVETAEE
jgi:apoptosis-inducing factor 1